MGAPRPAVWRNCGSLGVFAPHRLPLYLSRLLLSAVVTHYLDDHNSVESAATARRDALSPPDRFQKTPKEAKDEPLGKPALG